MQMLQKLAKVEKAPSLGFMSKQHGRNLRLGKGEMMNAHTDIRLQGYPATLVAREFLKLAKAEGRSLSPLRLMKLTYIAHGYSLSTFDRPLVSEEAQSWACGPVFRSLHQATRRLRSAPVENVEESPEEERLGLTDLSHDPDQTRLIEIIYGNYKKFPGHQLIDMTHRPDTPWNQTAQVSIVDPDEPIPDELVKAYYIGLDRAHPRRQAG